jgi:hypothetical protein
LGISMRLGAAMIDPPAIPHMSSWGSLSTVTGVKRELG